jgi:hypothetical protein
VEGFRNRPLEGRYPYLWLDALSPEGHASRSESAPGSSDCEPGLCDRHWCA